MASNAKRPEFIKLGGSIVENFKNFEVRFDDYFNCIQTNYRDITKVRTEFLNNARCSRGQSYRISPENKQNNWGG
jgi:hypothetical protein